MKKITFEGFKEVGTGGGCTAMEYALAHTYGVMVTDEGEIPQGDAADIILETNGAYTLGVSVDFARRAVDLIEETNDAQAELTLEQDGARLYFWHAGHLVMAGVAINWKRKSLTVLP